MRLPSLSVTSEMAAHPKGAVMIAVMPPWQVSPHHVKVLPNGTRT
jgi:hypothetical protein